MKTPESDEKVLRFGPSNGVLTGWLALAAVVVFVAFLLAERETVVGLRIVVAGLWLCVTIWAFMLRPSIEIGPVWLRLHNPLGDLYLPLEKIDKVVVRAGTYVFIGEKRYVGVAVSQTRRQMLRANRVPDRVEDTTIRSRLEPHQLSRFVEDRILEAAALARHDNAGADEVRRTRAVPEIVALSVLAVAFLVLLFL